MKSNEDPSQLVSSALINGFRRVEIAHGLLCANPDCRGPLAPHCFTTDGDAAVEGVCGHCHRTFLRLDVELAAEE